MARQLVTVITGMQSGGRLLSRVVDALRPVASPARPAVARLAVGTFAAINNWRRRGMVQKLHRQDAARFAPVGVARILKQPLPPRVADFLFDAAQVANLAATLGIGHRVTGPLNAALQLWTLTYRNSWGMIFHNDNMTLMHQVVLGATRSADALSVDAACRDRKLISFSGVPDRRYGGILTAMNLATTTVYFISGIAKVRSPKGWGWASGDTLREQIAADAIRKEVFGAKAPELAGQLYRSRAQFGALAVVTLIVELGAPLSLAHPRLGQLFAFAAWGMHVGIRAVMGIKFTYNTSGVSYVPYFALP